MSRILNKIRGNSSTDLHAAQEKPTVPDDGLRDVSMSEFLSNYVKSYASALSHTHGNPSKVPYPMQYYLPKTYLSMMADFKMDYISLLNTAAVCADPMQRFLGMLQYHISTINLTKFPYKPFFPRLGESFEVSVPSAQHGQTMFVAEQLHTDPAFTAYHIYNDQTRIQQSGTFEMAPSFHTSRIDVVFKGPSHIRLLNFNEEYTSDWPTVTIYLLKGRTELSGSSTLVCNNGLKALLTFTSDRAIHGTITQNNMPMYELSGRWDGAINISNTTTRQPTPFMNRSLLAKDVVVDPPFETLPPTSSQKLRSRLLAALAAHDYETARAVKNELELFSAQPHLFAKLSNGDYQYIGKQQH